MLVEMALDIIEFQGIPQTQNEVEEWRRTQQKVGVT